MTLCSDTKQRQGYVWVMRRVIVMNYKAERKLHERVISYLTGLPRLNNTTNVSVNSVTYAETPILYRSKALDHDSLVRELYYLQELGFITVNCMREFEDGSFSCNITLLRPTLTFLQDKHDSAVKSRIEWIKFWIPVTISVVALIISAIALLKELQVI